MPCRLAASPARRCCSGVRCRRDTSRPARPATELPYPLNSREGLLAVLLGVDGRHGRAAVAQDDAGGFQAELLPQLGGRVVAELVRVPVVPGVPRLDRPAVGVGQAGAVLLGRLAVAAGQLARRRVGLLEGPVVARSERSWGKRRPDQPTDSWCFGRRLRSGSEHRDSAAP